MEANTRPTALMWRVDSNGTRQTDDSITNSFLGVDANDLALPLPEGVIYEDDGDALKQWWSAIKDDRHLEALELRLRFSDGGIRWFLLHATPEHDSDGLQCWRCVCIDIDAKKLRETALQQREENWHSILDAIAQYVVVLDKVGTVTYVNQLVTRQIGMTTVDVGNGGNAFSLPFHPEDIDRVRVERAEGLADGRAFQLEVRVRQLDGYYRWHLMQYRPFRNETGELLRWYVTGTDIHERRKREEALEQENIALRRELSVGDGNEIVGNSQPMQALRKHVSRIASSDATVLIIGETGTGKELVAQALHRNSARSKKPFIRVNCAAIPQSLISSELFGHEKGAFTGATQRREGKFESANGGTLFLDEVGDLPPETQVALLRVLQEREIERIGSNTPVSIDIRLVAATHRDLAKAIEDGTFREDLFFRLNVLPLAMPSLRERPDDIPSLVNHFVSRFSARSGKKIQHIQKKTLAQMQAYAWPGNVRELQNIIERAVILSEGDTLFFDDSWLKHASKKDLVQPSMSLAGLQQQEKAMIEAALKASAGRISGPNGAAVRLGMPRQTLESKMKKFGITKA
ncbi:sigma-54-dependent Fis family transcriptional regulator [Terriglobus sp. TAA 43]|uniref:sigma-54-dependent Fis family transcriptional regulator n=1 Tax=Terriglobus sp. TAA 43 TaxID=278961 RepID=UPI000B1FFC13|nr:sigma-54-dependent Fis family transcriptional regulator [Terriglobus sp. TAA 43]